MTAHRRIIRIVVLSTSPLRILESMDRRIIRNRVSTYDGRSVPSAERARALARSLRAGEKEDVQKLTVGVSCRRRAEIV